MAMFTIELDESDATLLAQAAARAGVTCEAFIETLVREKLVEFDVPSSKGYLALNVLAQCNAEPSRKLGLSEILAVWNKGSGDADAGELIDGLKDLAEKKFVLVSETDVTISEKGYKLIGGGA